MHVHLHTDHLVAVLLVFVYEVDSEKSEFDGNCDVKPLLKKPINDASHFNTMTHLEVFVLSV